MIFYFDNENFKKVMGGASEPEKIIVKKRFRDIERGVEAYIESTIDWATKESDFHGTPISFVNDLKTAFKNFFMNENRIYYMRRDAAEMIAKAATRMAEEDKIDDN